MCLEIEETLSAQSKAEGAAGKVSTHIDTAPRWCGPASDVTQAGGQCPATLLVLALLGHLCPFAWDPGFLLGTEHRDSGFMGALIFPVRSFGRLGGGGRVVASL